MRLDEARARAELFSSRLAERRRQLDRQLSVITITQMADAQPSHSYDELRGMLAALDEVDQIAREVL